MAGIKTVMRVTVLSVVIVLMPEGLEAVGSTDSETPMQEARRFTGEVTVTVEQDYLVALPTGYDASGTETYPLLIFLHGAGERGSDLEKVKVHGPPKLIEGGEPLPFIVVSPQCAERSWWDVQVLDAWLDHVMASYRIDPDRVYLTGLSMGGYGTWSWASARPGRFAAIAPICGGGDPENAGALKDLPIWAFHGAQDRVVPVERTQQMVDALKALGSDVQFTIYPEAGHDSWTETYDNPRLYEWFLEQSRR